MMDEDTKRILVSEIAKLFGEELEIFCLFWSGEWHILIDSPRIIKYRSLKESRAIDRIRELGLPIVIGKVYLMDNESLRLSTHKRIRLLGKKIS